MIPCGISIRTAVQNKIPYNHKNINKQPISSTLYNFILFFNFFSKYCLVIPCGISIRTAVQNNVPNNHKNTNKQPIPSFLLYFYFIFTFSFFSFLFLLENVHFPMSADLKNPFLHSISSNNIHSILFYHLFSF